MQQLTKLSLDQPHKRIESVSMQDQSAKVAEERTHGQANAKVVEWESKCEAFNSKELRVQMVENIETKSTLECKLSGSLSLAMKIVPRHLFGDLSRFTKEKNGTMEDLVEAAYTYNNAMGATEFSNESAPEIIASQLSLTEIKQGYSVLLIGIKGGYVQSLVAQVVGEKGLVLTLSANKDAVQLYTERVNKNGPYKSIILWKSINNVEDSKDILKVCQAENRNFDTIIYCGAIDEFPGKLQTILKSSGSILAPVILSEDEQQFQLLEKRPDMTIIKMITGFGVIFGKVG